MVDQDAETPSELLDLLEGRSSPDRDGLEVHLSERDGKDLHDKMRQAYWWITNNAIISPYYDVEYGGRAAVENASGDQLALHDSMSYSSFVLMPLLTLFTCRRALMVGAPGRGKTTAAVLMGLIAGMSDDQIRRAIVRGHPQLTVSEMLGSPLPAAMMSAEEASDIDVAWRDWIDQRVKIIDEYNRIPTKTQSALLSLLAEGYAEMYDQYVYTGRSSWFLTANGDAGGGTFDVIDALQDRLDVVVRAVPFNSHFVATLLERIESDTRPESLIPDEIIFSQEELDAIYDAILAIEIPDEALDRVSYFLGQLDFCRMASTRFEFMSKDTLHLNGHSVASVCTEQCPLDKRQHLCTQTENGVSARVYLTCFHFAKALAYFRGHRSVELEDFRQILPWVLHDKLTPNKRSRFFEESEHRALLRDRVAWIRHLFDQAMDQYARHKSSRQQVRRERALLDEGLVGVDAEQVRERIDRVQARIAELMEGSELSGPIYEQVVQLKAIYSRYNNYWHWVTSGDR
jgi:MoxR-like ATPase